MTGISAAEVMDQAFVDRLSAEIDRVFARMSVSRGMGVLGSSAKPRLMAMVGPDPSAFTQMLGFYVELALTTGADKRTTASDDPGSSPQPKETVAELAEEAFKKVEPWTGTAADEFDEFIKSFRAGGSTATTQRLLIDRLSFAAEAQRQVYINSRMDLWNVVQSVDAAIDSSEDFSSSSAPMVLTVIAAIASAGVTVLAPGVGGAIIVSSLVAAAGSSGAAVISGHASDNRTDQELDPSDKYTIRDSLLDVIGTMEADLIAAEDTVRTAVDALTAQLDPMSNGGLAFIGPTVTGWDGGAAPIEWDLTGKASLPEAYLQGFLPPSATE